MCSLSKAKPEMLEQDIGHYSRTFTVGILGVSNLAIAWLETLL